MGGGSGATGAVSANQGFPTWLGPTNVATFNPADSDGAYSPSPAASGAGTMALYLSRSMELGDPWGLDVSGNPLDGFRNTFDAAYAAQTSSGTVATVSIVAGGSGWVTGDTATILNGSTNDAVVTIGAIAGVVTSITSIVGGVWYARAATYDCAAIAPATGTGLRLAVDSLTQPGASGGTVSVTAIISGAVSSFALSAAGSDYHPGMVLEAVGLADNSAISGNPAYFIVNSIGASGNITSLAMVNPGTGYGTNTYRLRLANNLKTPMHPYFNSLPVGDDVLGATDNDRFSGYGLTIDITSVQAITGAITGFAINGPGMYYKNNQYVTVLQSTAGRYNRNAVLKITSIGTNGAVAAVTLLSGGSRYVTAANVSTRGQRNYAYRDAAETSALQSLATLGTSGVTIANTGKTKLDDVVAGRWLNPDSGYPNAAAWTTTLNNAVNNSALYNVSTGTFEVSLFNLLGAKLIALDSTAPYAQTATSTTKGDTVQKWKGRFQNEIYSDNITRETGIQNSMVSVTTAYAEQDYVNAEALRLAGLWNRQYWYGAMIDEQSTMYENSALQLKQLEIAAQSSGAMVGIYSQTTRPYQRPNGWIMTAGGALSGAAAGASISAAGGPIGMAGGAAIGGVLGLLGAAGEGAQF